MLRNNRYQKMNNASEQSKTMFSDFEIEIKENTAKITFDAHGRIGRTEIVEVNEPIYFSVAILKTVQRVYREEDRIQEAKNLKYKGFFYLKYPILKIQR